MEKTKMMSVLKNEAQEYSFNVESPLFHKLPLDLREEWKKEVEQHFINGMLHTLNNPSGGALLYVNKKSYDIGFKDGFHEGYDERSKCK